MPLGTEVGLGLRNIVFDVDPVTPRKKAHPPQRNFGSCLFWPNGWMDEDTAWYGSRPRPRPHCTIRGPSSRERGTAAPFFCPCLLWPRSPISATAELLYTRSPRNRRRVVYLWRLFSVGKSAVLAVYCCVIVQVDCATGCASVRSVKSPCMYDVQSSMKQLGHCLCRSVCFY